MAVVDTRINYEHLKQLPDDGKRYEIVDGELLVSPSPNRRHQRCTQNIYVFFRRAEEAGYGEAYIAPFDVVFDFYNVTEPDVIFVSNERLGIITEDNIQGVPDIVVEVLSPGTRHRDEGIKLGLYGRMGVKHYLMSHPTEQVIYRYELGPDGYRELPALRAGDRLTSPIFGDLSVDVADLFR